MRRYFLPLAAALLAGCIASPSVVPPEPIQHEKNVQEAAAYCARDYMERAATAFEGLAAKIDAGEFKTQRELAVAIEESTKEARLAAFKELGEAWQRTNTDPWKPAVDAKNCRDTAAGYREVLK